MTEKNPFRGGGKEPFYSRISSGSHGGGGRFLREGRKKVSDRERGAAPWGRLGGRGEGINLTPNPQKGGKGGFVFGRQR